MSLIPIKTEPDNEDYYLVLAFDKRDINLQGKFLLYITGHKVFKYLDLEGYEDLVKEEDPNLQEFFLENLSNEDYDGSPWGLIQMHHHPEIHKEWPYSIVLRLYNPIPPNVSTRLINRVRKYLRLENVDTKFLRAMQIKHVTYKTYGYL